MERYIYNGKILSAYDCDTLTILFDLGFNISIEQNCRLYGVDAPELRTRNIMEKKLAIKGRDFVRELVVDKELLIKSHGTGKYGRILIEIFLEDGITLNNLLIEKNLVRPYFGGKREKWFS